MKQLKEYDIPPDAVLHLQTFGTFSLTLQGHSIDPNMGRSLQVWELIAYLILNRKRTVTHEELIEILWPSQRSDDPINALKNLIYRARALMDYADFSYPRERILCRGGVYRWNEAFPCQVDAEEFEALLAKAQDTSLTDDERIESGTAAVRLHRGDFLAFASSKPWIVPRATYYRSACLSCAQEICEMLLAKKRYDEAESLSRYALTIEPLEESINSCYLRALAGKNQPAAALEHYRQMAELFYSELGVRPSEELRSLYDSIAENYLNTQADLVSIQADLEESEAIPGAFLCSYEDFRSLYRVKSRVAARTGESVYIALLTVSGPDFSPLTGQHRSRAMRELQDAIRSSLRRGDVAARYSAAQYVLMLSSLTYEDGQVVLSRIEDAYCKSMFARRTRLATSLRPLKPRL